MNSPDDEWWDLQAGEYVIGTLPAAERATFKKLVETDSDTRRRVVWWEQRLAHLDRNVVPVDPPAAVWEGIQRRLLIPQETAVSPNRVEDIGIRFNQKREQQQSISTWRGLAAVATAACLVLAVSFWWEQADQQESGSGSTQLASFDGITIVLGDENQPLWIIDASRSEQQLRVTAVSPPAALADKSYELWMVKADDQGVSSMGLLPTTPARSVLISAPALSENGVAFAVSLEPAGGSPEAVPTGPVLYSVAIQNLISADSI